MILYIIIGATVAAFIVAIISIDCMIDNLTPDAHKQEKLRNLRDKHEWFAWKPVKINGKTVWLKTVYRDFEIIEIYGRLSANPEGPKYYLIGDEK